MAKTKISEYDATAANNTDVNSINIAEGCAPSGINNAIRQVMADLKDFQQGTKGDAFLGPVTPSTLTLTALAANRILYTNGSKVVATSDNVQFDGTTVTINSLAAVSITNSGNLTFSGSGNRILGNFSDATIGNRVSFQTSTSNTFTFVSAIPSGTGSASGFIALNSSDTVNNAVALMQAGSSDIRFASTVNGTGTALPMTFYTNANERIRIDTSGNVGIGTSSPAARLDVFGLSANSLQARFGSVSNRGLEISTALISGVNDAGSALNARGAGVGTLIFQTDSTERMRIDSSGNLLVGISAVPSAGNNGISVYTAGQPIIRIARAGTGSQDHAQFMNSNGIVGSISTSGSATTYSTSSDYRLKENIAPMTGALNVVSSLKPVTYNWKADGSSGQGFIAHELQSVVPDAVIGEKDAVDKDGKPVYQGVDTSFLVATLTAAIQEQQALIETLTTRLNALEGK